MGEALIGARYSVKEYIYSGGMSEVYEGIDTSTDNKVAIKICIDSIDDKCSVLSNEYKVLNILNESNIEGIPKVYDYYCTNDAEYLVMELIDAVTLDKYIKSNKLSNNEVIEIMLQICHIVQSMHDNRPPVYHCDIKPSNIMVNEGGVVLIDYGTAVMDNESGLRFGTVQYAAPEQFDCHTILDGRADIYGIGMLLESVMKSLSGGLKYGVKNIISACTYEDRFRRYSHVSDIITELMLLSGTDGLIREIYVP